MKKLGKDGKVSHKNYQKRLLLKASKKAIQLEKLKRKKERTISCFSSTKMEIQPKTSSLSTNILGNWEASRDGRVLLQAPKVFCLVETRIESLHFLRSLRQAGQREGQYIRIDMSTTEKMSSSATLMLYALVDSILIASKKEKPISMAYPLDGKIEQICQKIGLLNRLGMKSRLDPNNFPKDVSRWTVAYGSIFYAKDLHEHILSVLQQAGKEVVDRYNIGLKEAIGNCVEHAYIDLDGNDIRNDNSKWWMFGGIVDGAITFVVCDLGLGIPRTLPIKNDMAKIARYKRYFYRKMDLSSDEGKIEVACNLGKSRYGGNKGRGKGLAQLVELMQKGSPKANLMIHSNRGLVQFSGVKGTKPYKLGLEASVMGTVLQWSSPIQTDLAKDRSEMKDI